MLADLDKHPNVRQIAKWGANRNFDTPAFLNAKQILWSFCDLEIGDPNLEAFEHSWKISEGRERLQVKCENCFLIEAALLKRTYEISQLLEVLNAIVGRTQQLGKIKARTAREEFIAKALEG